MKKFQDESGWLRAAVCCAVLLTQYGIRDSLLTALPNIATGNATDPEAGATTLPEATTVSMDALIPNGSSSNGSNSEEYRHANLESKSDYFQKEDHERKSSKEFEFDNLTELRFQEMSEKYSETQRHLLSQQLFWAKLAGRNAARKKLKASSISHRGKYIPFFFTLSDGEERDVFRRLLDQIRTGNERKREDVRTFIIEDEFLVPLLIDEQNSSGGSWNTMNKGIVLSSVYWGWLITALLANFVISKLGANLVIALSVSIGSLMGLLTHASSLGGPWVLLPFRIVFGAAQGFCYPAVTRLLQGIPESSRMLAGTLVFIGPSLGSCLGAGLGSLEAWYISTYLLGSLALPLVPLCFMVPGKKDEQEKSIPVTHVLKTAGVWACIIVYVANIFTFHTVLVGLPFCIAEGFQVPDTTGVVLLSMILVVAIVIRVAAVLSAIIGGKISLTVLNKRRIPVALGSLLLFVALIVMATAGLTDFGALVGLAIGCAGPGVGLTRICCRLNLEDLAPWTLPRLVNMVNIVGIFVAVWPPLLVAGLAEVDESGWVAIWLIPLAVIVPSSVSYMFLLTGNSQTWDERPDPKTSNLPNGTGPPRDSPAARGHISRLSFKSARSGLSFKSVLSFQSFKTAVSRRRTRTLSTRTVDEDLSVDMHSVIDEGEGAEVYSIEGSNQDCKSVVSTASFKSDGADMHSIDLNSPEDRDEQQHQKPELSGGSSSERTSAWLSHHHQVSIENAPLPVPTKDEMRRRNAIYDLFW